jgi:hypothetical protein
MTLAQRDPQCAGQPRAAEAQSRVTPLWRTDGARRHAADLRLGDDGGLTLTHHETGPTLEDAWGADDYEATLEIAPGDVGRLALVLLQTAFAGDPNALAKVKVLCERRGVPFRFAVWT